MARGQPDYGMYAQQVHTAGMSDMAELAVRLGSIDIFDRRGSVICLDDFNAPKLKWEAELSDEATIFLSDYTAKSGSQCVKLHVPATADLSAWLRRGFALLASKRHGSEISFSLPHTSAYLTSRIDYFDGKREYQAVVRLDFNARELAYYDGFGWIWIADMNKPIGDLAVFETIKLVADFDEHKYVRVMLGGQEYDLSSYDIYSVPNLITPPHFRPGFVYEARVAVASDIYLDDFILTQDEP